MKRAQGSSEEATEMSQNRDDLRLSTVESESQSELCGETDVADQESEEDCKGLISPVMPLLSGPIFVQILDPLLHVVCTRLVTISLVVKHSPYIVIVGFMESQFAKSSNVEIFLFYLQMMYP